MKKLFLIILILFISNFYFHHCYAQGKKGKIGISGSIQSLQTDFSIPIWTSDKVVIAPSFGLINISKKATDLSLGLTIRKYISVDKVSPNFGFRFASLILIPKDGDTLYDYIAGITGGTEYFFDSKFSIGGEIQLNISISDTYSNRFGNPDGHIINTGMAIYATFYFN